jgi:putative endonuclease
MAYFVYIVRCCDQTFYTGVTNDLEKRILAHNGLSPQGAKYTRNRRPVQLHYCEEYLTKSEALKREYAVKRLSHLEKAKLINGKTI